MTSSLDPTPTAPADPAEASGADAEPAALAPDPPRTGNLIGYWAAHLVVLAYSGVLLGGFAVQFGEDELPCPLCILQRMAMMLCVIGPLRIIARARRGDLDLRGYVAGYGMSIVAAVVGMTISTRQILLHIDPGDPGYGDAVLGLHLYSWALVTFVIVVVFCGAMLVFARETLPVAPAGRTWALASTVVVGLFLALIAANLVSVFFEEGFNWILPDDPDRWELLHTFD